MTDAERRLLYYLTSNTIRALRAEVFSSGMSIAICRYPLPGSRALSKDEMDGLERGLNDLKILIATLEECATEVFPCDEAGAGGGEMA